MGNTRNSTNLLSTDPGNLKREKIRTIPITLIDSANVHPFQVKEDDELRSLMESISQLGVITPCIVRRKGEERYELISGHRRKRACELLGIDTLPIIVRELSEDEAVILMVDSNLQREHILPSEKAFAYKLKLDALKRQGRRNDITSPPVVSKFRTGDFVPSAWSVTTGNSFTASCGSTEFTATSMRTGDSAWRENLSVSTRSPTLSA